MLRRVQRSGGAAVPKTLTALLNPIISILSVCFVYASIWDGESLRSCRLDTMHGVNIGVELTDDSVRQFSRAQRERAKKTQQPAQQEEARKGDGVNSEAEDILAIIPESPASGRIAKFDAFLKNLNEDEASRLLQTNSLDEDERFIIETFLTR